MTLVRYLLRSWIRFQSLFNNRRGNRETAFFPHWRSITLSPKNWKQPADRIPLWYHRRVLYQYKIEICFCVLSTHISLLYYNRFIFPIYASKLFLTLQLFLSKLNFTQEVSCISIRYCGQKVINTLFCVWLVSDGKYPFKKNHSNTIIFSICDFCVWLQLISL